MLLPYLSHIYLLSLLKLEQLLSNCLLINIFYVKILQSARSSMDRAGAS